MPVRKGKCLCGEVSISANVTGGIQACHCVQCQRWTGGGPYLAAAASDIVVSGEAKIAAYHASEWGERGFCEICGSTIYWTVKDRAPETFAVGLLDDQSAMHVNEEIFVDHRPGWLKPWPGASQSTEAQEKAKLAEFLDRENL